MSLRTLKSLLPSTTSLAEAVANSLAIRLWKRGMPKEAAVFPWDGLPLGFRV